MARKEEFVEEKRWETISNKGTFRCQSCNGFILPGVRTKVISGHIGTTLKVYREHKECPPRKTPAP